MQVICMDLFWVAISDLFTLMVQSYYGKSIKLWLRPKKQKSKNFYSLYCCLGIFIFLFTIFVFLYTSPFNESRLSTENVLIRFTLAACQSSIVLRTQSQPNSTFSFHAEVVMQTLVKADSFTKMIKAAFLDSKISRDHNCCRNKIANFIFSCFFATD